MDTKERKREGSGTKKPSCRGITREDKSKSRVTREGSESTKKNSLRNRQLQQNEGVWTEKEASRGTDGKGGKMEGRKVREGPNPAHWAI